jgi:hypothetical protein
MAAVNARACGNNDWHSRVLALSRGSFARFASSRAFSVAASFQTLEAFEAEAEETGVVVRGGCTESGGGVAVVRAI